MNENTSTKQIKKLEPENEIWTKFVCKHTILRDEITNLESNFHLIDEHQKTPFLNFSDSLKAIDRIICLPFVLAFKHKFNLSTRSLLKHYEKITPQSDFLNRDAWIAEIKCKAYEDFNKQAFGDDDNFLKDLANDMLTISEPEYINLAALELRYQSTVSLWSCLETLIKDHLIYALNNNPLHVIKIANEEKLRKEIGFDKVDFTYLMENKFNLQNKVGDFIFSNQNSGKIGNLKLILKNLYGNEISLTNLDSGIIFELNLRRNLIVHSRGLIDCSFKSKSNTKLNIGDRINITPGELVSGFRAVTNFGAELVHAFLKIP